MLQHAEQTMSAFDAAAHKRQQRSAAPVSSPEPRGAAPHRRLRIAASGARPSNATAPAAGAGMIVSKEMLRP